MGGAIKRNAGKIAREAAVGGAGAGATLACLPALGPGAAACGAAASYAVNEYLGDPIERQTRRALDKSTVAADDFVAHLRGTGEEAARPPQMATTVSGIASPQTVAGAYEDEPTDYTLPVAIGAGVVATTAVTVLVLHYTGRLPGRA